MGEINISKQVKKDKIKLVSLQFTDLFGVVKEVVIPIKELDDALANGVWFDGSSIEGFARIQESDLFLKPDPRTYAIVPWTNENGRTARLICDIYSSDGEPFVGDPRYVLRKAIEELNKQGMQFNVGPEPEFYLFEETDKGRKPIDTSGYFDMTSHRGYKVIKDIITALKSFGINVETSHHEVGHGQYEIDFNYGPALQIADKLLTLKYTVKKIAQIHGLRATFMPKPIMGAAGNGLHIHQSMSDIKTGKNVFFDPEDKYGLSEKAYQFMAGQMKHVKAMCAVICPLVNSYKRLVSGFEAPVYITWAGMNRSSLIRIPKWFKQKPSSARIELRCPDPSCNPYLAFAVMLKAGLKGIENKKMPPKPVEENVYQFDEEVLVNKNIDTLPSSLYEAISFLQKDDVIKKALGDFLSERYYHIKNKEIQEYSMQVTPWEEKKYLDVY